MAGESKTKQPKTAVPAGSTQDQFKNGRRISASYNRAKTLRVSLTIRNLLGNKPISLPLTKKCKTIKQNKKPDEWPTILTPVRFYRELGIEPQPHHCNKKGTAQRFDDGWLYIFVNGYLWRELQVGRSGRGNQFWDVNLDTELNKNQRIVSGQSGTRVLVPAKVQNKTMSIQVGFSEVQWSWKRIQSLGGVSPEGIERKKWYLDEYHTMNEKGKSLREKRLQPVWLSKAHGNSYSTKKDNLGPITKKNLYEFKIDTNKKIAAFGVYDPVGDAKDLAFTYLQSWKCMKKFIEALANPAKKNRLKHPFSPWFDTAVLANQYFFSESIKSDTLPRNVIQSFDHDGSKYFSSKIKDRKPMVVAWTQRKAWKTQLSLDDIQIALGTKKRVELRKNIVDSKQKLVDYLKQGSETLAKFVPAFDDYCSLPIPNSKNNDNNHCGLVFELGDELFAQLCDHKFTLDMQLETQPLSEKLLYKLRINDPGYKFLAELLDGKHDLSRRFFIDKNCSKKQNSTNSSPTSNEVKSESESGGIFQTIAKAGQVIRYGSQSIVTFVSHFAYLGIEFQNKKNSKGKYINRQKSIVELFSQILDPNSEFVKIHVTFQEFASGVLVGKNGEKYEIIKSKKIGVDQTNPTHATSAASTAKLPGTNERASVLVYDTKGNLEGSTSLDSFNSGKGAHANKLKKFFKPTNGQWQKFTLQIWVAKKPTGVKGFSKRALESGALKKMLPVLLLIESWNLCSFFSKAIEKDADIGDQENLTGAFLDFAALSAMVIEERLKNTRRLLEIVHDKPQPTVALSVVEPIARVLGIAASAYSTYLSYKDMMQSIHEGDDAYIGKSMQMIGFALAALSEAVSLAHWTFAKTAGQTLAERFLAESAVLRFITGPLGWIGLTLITAGIALLIWVFKEDTLMEQWLKHNPFAINTKRSFSVQDKVRFTRYHITPNHLPPKDTEAAGYYQFLHEKFIVNSKGILLRLGGDQIKWRNPYSRGRGKKRAEIYITENNIKRLVAKIGEPLNLDRMAERSERFGGFSGKGIEAVRSKFAQWQIQPLSCYHALRNIIYSPTAKVEFFAKRDPKYANHDMFHSAFTAPKYPIGWMSQLKVKINIPYYYENKTLVYLVLEYKHGGWNKYKRAPGPIFLTCGKGDGPRTIAYLTYIPGLWLNARVKIYIDLHGDGKETYPMKEAEWTTEQDSLRYQLLAYKIAKQGKNKIADKLFKETKSLLMNSYTRPDFKILPIVAKVIETKPGYWPDTKKTDPLTIKQYKYPKKSLSSKQATASKNQLSNKQDKALDTTCGSDESSDNNSKKQTQNTTEPMKSEQQVNPNKSLPKLKNTPTIPKETLTPKNEITPSNSIPMNPLKPTNKNNHNQSDGSLNSIQDRKEDLDNPHTAKQNIGNETTSKT